MLSWRKTFKYLLNMSEKNYYIVKYKFLVKHLFTAEVFSFLELSFSKSYFFSWYFCSWQSLGGPTLISTSTPPGLFTTRKHSPWRHWQKLSSLVLTSRMLRFTTLNLFINTRIPRGRQLPPEWSGFFDHQSDH